MVNLMDKRQLQNESQFNDPIFAEQNPELDALAELLRQSAETLPPVQFRAMARRRLLAQLPDRPAPRPSWFAQLVANWQTAQRPTRPALAWAVLLFALVTSLFVGGGAVYASGDALPDDGLYPVKLTMEDARVWLTRAELEQAQLHLTFAGRRLAEMDKLQEMGKWGGMPTAVDRYIYHAHQLQDLLLDQTDDPAQFDLAQQSWDAFVENERHLITIAQQSDPVSWAGLNRAFTAAGRGREQAQTALLNAAANVPAQAQMRLEFAATRVTLAGNLVEAGRAEEAHQALTSYVEEIEAINLTLTDSEIETAFLVDWSEALANQQEALMEMAESEWPKPSAAIANARQVSQAGREMAQALIAEKRSPNAPPHAGPPEDKPGGGPPENKPGGGPPENKPGGGPPEDRPGNRPGNNSGGD
jgi:hypothetical protein